MRVFHISFIDPPSKTGVEKSQDLFQFIPKTDRRDMGEGHMGINR